MGRKKKDDLIISTPHDRFFKIAFERKDVAMDYLNTFLPVGLSAGLDYDSMCLDTTSYIDEHLKKHYSDVAWSIMYNGVEISVVFLLEHKSYPDDNVPFQVLRYMLCMWEYDLREKRPLRVVVPVIVYHGAEDWVVKPMEEYFGEVDERLSPYIPKIQMEFKSLTSVPDETLRGLHNAQTFMAIVALARGQLSNFWEKYFHEIAERLQGCSEAEIEKNFSVALYVYLTALSQKSPEEYKQIIENSPSQVKTTGMSTYDMIIELGVEKGRLEGIEKGIEKGLHKAVSNVIQKSPQLTDKDIAELVGVEVDFVKQVRAGMAG